MKKYLLIVLLLLFCHIVLFSQNVTIEEAKDVAKWVMEQHCLGQRARGFDCSETPLVASVKEFVSDGENTMYAVNMATGGYVLVAADERVTPILSVSYENEFPSDTADMPCALKELLADYENTIIHVRNSGQINEPDPMWIKAKSHANIVSKTKQMSATGYNPGTSLFEIEGREEMNWGQSVNGYPYSHGEYDINRSYNKFCPDWYDTWQGRCVVGCTAVAMGQIMWYWQWPNAAYVPAKIYMTGVTYGGSVFHEYDWNLMPERIVRSTPIGEIDMIAGFLRDCGYACNSIYGKSGTSSDIFAAQRAFSNRFAYECDGVEMRMFSNKKNWDKKIKAEIDALRPVLYGGADDNLGGHAFAIVGYHESFDGMFLVNFGWRGEENDFYSLKTYSKSDSIIQYHNFQIALFGLRPSCKKDIVKSNVTITNKDANPVYEYCYGNLTLDKVKVASSGSLVCHAGNSIRLVPGTTISQGGRYHGSIKQFPFPYLSQTEVNMLYSDYEEEEDKEVELADIFSKDVAGEKSLHVYPNPTNSVINISSSESITFVRLINLQGKELKRQTYLSNCISLSEFDNGLYLLEVTFDDGMKSIDCK